MTKEMLVQTIKTFPEEITFEEIIDKLLYLKNIEEGLKQSEEGLTVSEEEVHKMLLKFS